MDIKVDLHTHTVASGHAYSTLSENALAASHKGISLLGMTDHAPSMPGAPHLYHFGNLATLPEELYGVRILPGVEANITNYEGELDIPVDYLSRMKIVLVGLHLICYPGGTSEQNTESYMKGMKNPYTDMMVHPLSLIHISEPTRLGMISYAVFCLKKKKHINKKTLRH